MRWISADIQCGFVRFVCEAIQQRQHQQREQCRRQDAADDHGCQRALHLSTGAGRYRHRDETERRNQGSHQHGAQPRQRTLVDRFIQAHTVFAQTADVGDHHQPVQHGDAA